VEVSAGRAPNPPEPPKPSLSVALPSAAPPSTTAPLPVEQAVRVDGATPRRWLRPAAYGAGAVAGGLLVLAIQQGLAARSAYSDADALVRGDGALLSSARYHALVDDGNAARRNAYVSAGLAVAFGAAAGYLGWKSVDHSGPALALRF
jgi:hypothetical protein